MPSRKTNTTTNPSIDARFERIEEALVKIATIQETLLNNKEDITELKEENKALLRRVNDIEKIVSSNATSIDFIKYSLLITASVALSALGGLVIF